MQNIFRDDEFNTDELETIGNFNQITPKEKFIAAKQILVGIALLYLLTMGAALYKPSNSTELLDICKTIYPPLATLIIACYFRDKAE